MNGVMQMKSQAFMALVFIVFPISVLADEIYDESKIAFTPQGNAIKYGRKIIERTYETLPQNVGNKMNCTSCHQAAGTKPGALPFIGLPAIFPEYNKRLNKLISLQERINECFKRSENGHPLSFDSIEMNSILAYMSYISKGVPAGEAKGRGLARMVQLDTTAKPVVGNATRGKSIYEAKCSICHQANGGGIANVFPALWGKDSFNDQAGMSNADNATLFIYANMPKSAPGTLTWQEAADVAQYMDSQSRPHFNSEE